MNRRDFCAGAAVAAIAAGFAAGTSAATIDIAGIDRRRVLAAADRYLRRSAGHHRRLRCAAKSWPGDTTTIPKPTTGGPIRPIPRARIFGATAIPIPDKFVAHREALIRLGVQVPALAAAWKITGQARYAVHAEKHLDAWFVSAQTRMNPNLDHAQAIIGVNTGRGIGVIDTLHLVEVARAVGVLRDGRKDQAIYKPVTGWFADYLTWMTTSTNGTQERDERNNHGTCWALQAASFARLTGNGAVMDLARSRIKALVPGQIAVDGGQPLELARTKPYGYCLFNLDVLAASAFVLSTPSQDLWRYKGAGGGSIADALAYMAPFIADKSSWTRPPDVEAFAGWPVRHPSLLFGGLSLARPDYLAIWGRLNPDPTENEIIRNYPIRQPVLWLDT
jgi:hypothetical protein